MPDLEQRQGSKACGLTITTSATPKTDKVHPIFGASIPGASTEFPNFPAVYNTDDTRQLWPDEGGVADTVEGSQSVQMIDSDRGSALHDSLPNGPPSYHAVWHALNVEKKGEMRWGKASVRSLCQPKWFPGRCGAMCMVGRQGPKC